MSDTFFFLSSTMSNDHERIREIKYHINQLLSELRLIEPNNSYLEKFQPFNITLNSSLTTISNEKCLLDHQCPYLSRKQAILHSTTYHEYKKIQQRKKCLTLTPKRNFVALACATSTPKNSPNQNILLKPHLTSTPRRNKRQSTNFIPLKRLLYNNNNNNNNNKDFNRQRTSAKRSILPRYSPLHPIDENPQWV
jgi:hypothetical protein